jgi:hypothetical protein
MAQALGEKPINDDRCGWILDRPLSGERMRKRIFSVLAALVAGARHVTNTNSGHEIHKDPPQLAADSIHDVVATVRNGKTSLAP